MERGFLGLVCGVAICIPVLGIAASPAGADTDTFTTADRSGVRGQTPQFTETGNSWTLSWSYNCSGFGSTGNFGVSVNQPSGDLYSDPGPNELGMGGSGTDHYFDTGVFSLSVISECSWSITVSPSGVAPTSTPATFTSGQIGATGSSPQFAVSGAWTMAWSYNCASFGSTGNFAVSINQPSGDFTFDIGPNELGTGGSGTDSYTDTGVFNLSILSECSWSITVSGPGAPAPAPPSPAPALAPPPPPPAVGMVATPDGGGYWIADAAGDVFSFGDAHFYGSMGGKALDRPIVGIASTPTGGGYWLVASDGGLFSFGNAQFYGSMGGKPLDKPVVGMTSTPRQVGGTGRSPRTVGCSASGTLSSMARWAGSP